MESRSTVQSVERALQILEWLGASETPLSLSKIARDTGMPVSTAHRLLGVLRAHDLVRYDADERLYGVGLAVLALAERARTQISIHRDAQPILEALADHANETATLVLVSGTTGTYAAMAPSARSMATTAQLGEQVPLHCTAAGKAILAHLPQRTIEEVLAGPLKAHTPHTIANPYQLRDELARVRAMGLAFDREERESGMHCIAAPVFDHQGRVCATIGISGPATRIALDPESELSGYVAAAAVQLSARLGYRRDRFRTKEVK